LTIDEALDVGRQIAADLKTAHESGGSTVTSSRSQRATSSARTDNRQSAELRVVLDWHALEREHRKQ